MFFKKRTEKVQKQSTSEDIAISSIIGKEMVITGDVSFNGKLRLDGKVEGNVKGEHCIVGASGRVNGDLDVQTCVVQGKVYGNIKALDLNIINGCRIEGNVEAGNLLVETGSALHGEVKVNVNDLRLVKNDAAASDSDGQVLAAGETS